MFISCLRISWRRSSTSQINSSVHNTPPTSGMSPSAAKPCCRTSKKSPATVATPDAQDAQQQAKLGKCCAVKELPSAPVPITPFVFPYSSRARTRTLVLRNNCDQALFVKLVPSNPNAIRMEKEKKFCEAWGQASVVIQYNPQELQNKKETATGDFLDVYCIGVVNRGYYELHNWLNTYTQTDSELAFRLRVVRCREFSALETVVDLPGLTSPIKAIDRPSYRVDDYDCLTAHNIDSETDTVMSVGDVEMLAMMPIDEAEPGRCWLSHALEQIFPVHGAAFTATVGKTFKDAGIEMPCGGGNSG